MELVDLRTFKCVTTFEHDNYINGTSTNNVSVSCNGTYAAVGSKNGNLLIFNIPKGELEEMYTNEHTNTIVGCAW